jgi:hypothetical protein
VKMHDVEDPGDDQGKAAEKAHSAKEPNQQRASRLHRWRSGDSLRVRTCQRTIGGQRCCLKARAPGAPSRPGSA